MLGPRAELAETAHCPSLYQPDTMRAWLGPTVWMLPMLVTDHQCHSDDDDHSALYHGSRLGLDTHCSVLPSKTLMLQPSPWTRPGQYRPIRSGCWWQRTNERRLRCGEPSRATAINRIPARRGEAVRGRRPPEAAETQTDPAHPSFEARAANII